MKPLAICNLGFLSHFLLLRLFLLYWNFEIQLEPGPSSFPLLSSSLGDRIIALPEEESPGSSGDTTTLRALLIGRLNSLSESCELAFAERNASRI